MVTDRSLWIRVSRERKRVEPDKSGNAGNGEVEKPLSDFGLSHFSGSAF